MANTAIYRTLAESGSGTVCTLSVWFKKTFLGEERALWGGWRSSTTRFQIRFKTDDTIDVEYGYSSSWYSLITNRKFRDTGAWMHLVLAIDSTETTPADREKLYINGVQETSFSTENYMPQNYDTLMTASGDEVMVGCSNASGSAGSHQSWWKGNMSWAQFVDGAQLAPTEFGEVDATSGIWKIKTDVYGTPGTTGFCLKMEDRTNLDLDSSSNAFTFSTEGTLTATYDNPSNNFCTMNPLDNYWLQGTFTNGNTTVETSSAEYGYATGTLAAAGGKWYWEMKLEQEVTATNYISMGIAGRPTDSADGLGYESDAIAYQAYDGKIRDSGTLTTYGNTWGVGDIIGVAMDLDNSKLYFSINGVWQDSGDPTSGATGTGAHSMSTAVANTLLGAYYPAFGDHGGSGYTTGIGNFNFGNGYFKTTAVTEPADADDAGIGAMEYDVPAGYYCLCTRNIKAYGGAA